MKLVVLTGNKRNIMKCKDVLNLIDDGIDNALSPSIQLEVAEHCHTCESCKEVAEQTEQLINGLNNLPFEAHSDDFETRVFENVKQQYSLKNKKRVITGFAGAIAASMAFLMASILLLPNVDTTLHSDAIKISLHETRNVRLVIDSPADYEKVQFKITLPKNITMQGLKNKSELVWVSKLKAGPNVLSLPVTAIAEGQTELTAEIKLGNTTKIMKIILKANKKGLNEAIFDNSTPLHLV